MNIIEITGEPILHGGQEKFIENIVGNIDMTDLHIDVLTPYQCENPSFQELLHSKGGEVFHFDLPFRIGKSRRMLLRPIQDFLQGHHYDVAHIHSGSISVLAYAALAARHAKVKKIIVHSHSTGIESLKHSIIRAVFAPVLNANATCFLACSREAGLTKFTKSVVRHRLQVVRNGISIDTYRRNPEKRAEIRSRLGIPEKCFVIGHVGRFSTEKNHAFLIDLFSQIRQRSPDCRLLLVGDGERSAEIHQQVEALSLVPYVIFTGNVDNVQDYYQAMDCFVLPSLYEGFSLVTLEAQAAGLPCVISDGVPEDVVIGAHVKKICLSQPQMWMETILACSDLETVDNTQAIRTAGYDVRDTAAVIRELYLQ